MTSENFPSPLPTIVRRVQPSSQIVAVPHRPATAASPVDSHAIQHSRCNSFAHVSSQAQAIRISQLEATITDMQSQLESRTREVAMMSMMLKDANVSALALLDAPDRVGPTLSPDQVSRASMTDLSPGSGNNKPPLSDDVKPQSPQADTAQILSADKDATKPFQNELSEASKRLSESDQLVRQLRDELDCMREQLALAMTASQPTIQSPSPSPDLNHELTQTRLMIENLQENHQVLYEREQLLLDELSTAHEVIDRQHEKIEALMEQQRLFKQAQQKQQQQQRQPKKHALGSLLGDRSHPTRLVKSGNLDDENVNLQKIIAFLDNPSLPMLDDLRAQIQAFVNEHARIRIQLAATSQRLGQQIDVNKEIKRLIVQSSIGPQLGSGVTTTGPNSSKHAHSQPTTSLSALSLLSPTASVTSSWFRGISPRNTALDSATEPESLLQKYNDALVAIAELQEELANTRLDSDAMEHVPSETDALIES